jgi:succinylarginine dihydrolase
MNRPDPAQPDDTLEVNFDGLIGPTHNFSGLAPGNLASVAHRYQTSHPRAAAHQGLAKMQRLRRLGIPQAVLPPQPRPNLTLLRRLGFSGPDASVLAAAQKQAPHLLAAASSGSSMWTANAATVCPSADSADGRVHFTPANLVTSLHRASETDVTATILRHVFCDERHFVHHRPLTASTELGDEGAANHTRFCEQLGSPGVQLFVYGSDPRGGRAMAPSRFPARQSRAASEAVARLHGVHPDRLCFARQSGQAIDAGVFHNDVIAVGHRLLLFCHETAFAAPDRVYADLRESTEGKIRIVEVPSDRLSLGDAVSTYLFNSQIVTTADDRTVLVAPDHCRHHDEASALIDELVSDRTLGGVEFVDVGQSMSNGGGPACLRLRVVLTAQQRAAVAPGVLLTDKLFARLTDWVDRHYRESLTQAELADRRLMIESHDALDELSGLLGLGSIYEFQR